MAQRERPAIADSIDAYLAPLDAARAAALTDLRRIVRAAVPAAQECISYGLPAFRVSGKLLVSFGAGAHHCAFYPGSVIKAFSAELSGFELGRGTIRFQPDRPIPPELVERLVRARLERISAAPPSDPRARRPHPRAAIGRTGPTDSSVDASP